MKTILFPRCRSRNLELALKRQQRKPITFPFPELDIIDFDYREGMSVDNHAMDAFMYSIPFGKA